MPWTETAIGIGYFASFLFAWRGLYVSEKDEHLEKMATNVGYKRRVENGYTGPSYFMAFLLAVVWPFTGTVAILMVAIPWLWKHSIGRETPYERKLRTEQAARETERLIRELDLGLKELPEKPTKWETTFDRKMQGLTEDDFLQNIVNRYPKKSLTWQVAQAKLQYNEYSANWEED
jgi:hypothetical protein